MKIHQLIVSLFLFASMSNPVGFGASDSTNAKADQVKTLPCPLLSAILFHCKPMSRAHS